MIRNFARASSLAVSLLLAAPPVLAVPFTDALGDAVTGGFRTYDITAINASFIGPDIAFTVTLSSAPLAPSSMFLAGIRGYIDIDTDSLAATGSLSNITAAGLMFPGFGSSGLGIEFFLDLFSEQGHAGFVELKNPALPSPIVGVIPISYGTSSFSVKVPLSLLGPDDGFVSYAVLVGDAGGPTDQARDPGFIQAGGMPAISSPASTVPAPPTPLLLALGCCIAWMFALKRRE